MKYLQVLYSSMAFQQAIRKPASNQAGRGNRAEMMEGRQEGWHEGGRQDCRQACKIQQDRRRYKKADVQICIQTFTEKKHIMPEQKCRNASRKTDRRTER